MIQAKHINKHYGELQVLNDVSIHVKKSEIISIVGSSGAGKTTLLQILGTLDKPDKNNKTSIVIRDVEITKLKQKELAKFRNKHIGFIFQFHQLLPEFTALENVCIPAYIQNTPQRKSVQRAKELLEFLNLKDRIHHKPDQLSGGEQQRVAVARSLINKPSVIFADEPSGNLDSVTATYLHKLFFDLRKEFKQTFVIVTHNKDLANMADRKLVMKDGKFITQQ